MYLVSGWYTRMRSRNSCRLSAWRRKMWQKCDLRTSMLMILWEQGDSASAAGGQKRSQSLLALFLTPSRMVFTLNLQYLKDNRFINIKNLFFLFPFIYLWFLNIELSQSWCHSNVSHQFRWQLHVSVTLMNLVGISDYH